VLVDVGVMVLLVLDALFVVVEVVAEVVVME
jgi:hypothetical protein